MKNGNEKEYAVIRYSLLGWIPQRIEEHDTKEEVLEKISEWYDEWYRCEIKIGIVHNSVALDHDEVRDFIRETEDVYGL